MTKEKIVEKLKKLKAHSKSAQEIGNEAEAQAFATKLQELLSKHDIEMTDIEWEEVRKIEGVHIQWTTKCMYPNHPLYKLPTWAYQLAMSIAKYSQCEILVSTYGITFLGMENHATIAKETMDYMFCAAERLSYAAHAKAYSAGTAGKGYRASFLVGFISRLNQRFKEYQESLQTATQSTALVRISQALTVAKDTMAKWKAGNPDAKSKTINSGKVHNHKGYRDGVAKANEMNVGGQQLKSGSHQLGK